MGNSPEEYPYNVSYLRIGDKFSDVHINKILDLLLNKFKKTFSYIIDNNRGYDDLQDISLLNFNEKINYIMFFHSSNQNLSLSQKKDVEKISCGEIKEIIENHLSNQLNHYEKLKKNFRNNIWLSKKFLEPKNDYDKEEGEKKIFLNIGDKEQINTWDDLDRIYQLIERQKITPSIYLFNSILNRLGELTPVKIHFMLEIKKLFINELFQNIIPNALTFQIILKYKNTGLIKIKEILNLIDIIKIHSDFQFEYITKERENEFLEKFKLTFGDITQELTKRYNENKK